MKDIHMFAVSTYFSCITVKQILNTNIYLQGFFPEIWWELNMPNNESEPLSIFNLITISEHFETLIYRPGKVLSLQVATFFWLFMWYFSNRLIKNNMKKYLTSLKVGRRKGPSWNVVEVHGGIKATLSNPQFSLMLLMRCALPKRR